MLRALLGGLWCYWWHTHRGWKPMYMHRGHLRYWCSICGRYWH